MKPIAKMSRAELGAWIQEHLRHKGIDMVLGGEACVSIYSKNRYESMDLDMIHTSLMSPKRKSIREVLTALGFAEDGRCFKHPDTELFVEFPAGPPAVGEEPVKEIQERVETTGILRIISPTDCVKDRLTGFYHDQDLQCLDQAILVARENEVDIKEVERWSRGEGRFEQFKRICKELEA